jgi:hypothetical protein
LFVHADPHVAIVSGRGEREDVVCGRRRSLSSAGVMTASPVVLLLDRDVGAPIRLAVDTGVDGPAGENGGTDAGFRR